MHPSSAERRSASRRGRHVGEWSLRTNTVTFPLHSHLRLTGRTLEVDVPRMVLGLVPVGRMRRSFPVTDIAAIEVRGAFHPTRAVAAGALFVIAAMHIGGPVATALLTVLAVGLLILSLIVEIRVRDVHAGTRSVPACWFQRRAAHALVAQVRRAMPAERKADA